MIPLLDTERLVLRGHTAADFPSHAAAQFATANRYGLARLVFEREL